MNLETQQAIYDRYPEIFRDKDLPMTQTCMCWGLECDDGWAPIIDALCATIQKPYSGGTSTAEDGGTESFSYEFPQVRAVQAKEKMGSFRFYYDLEPDAALREQTERYPKTVAAIMECARGYVDGAVAMAETLSLRTCEVTGKPGSLHVRGGWYKVLCTESARELGYETMEAERAAKGTKIG